MPAFSRRNVCRGSPEEPSIPSSQATAVAGTAHGMAIIPVTPTNGENVKAAKGTTSA